MSRWALAWCMRSPAVQCVIPGCKSVAQVEDNAHAAELGTSIARKILQRNVTADDQQSLVDESLAEMAKKN